ncbi:hypothetical protein ACFL6N_05520 [Thermodesulfobacteriota bacterium]
MEKFQGLLDCGLKQHDVSFIAGLPAECQDLFDQVGCAFTGFDDFPQVTVHRILLGGRDQ